MIRNLVQYKNQASQNLGEFIYKGTTALKKGDGMCFDMDYLTTATGEKAVDPFGARGMKVVAVPAPSNSNRFAGVPTQDYPARDLEQIVQLAQPGGCAMIAQRVISTSGVGRVTCIVDQTAGDGVSGKFGHGGLCGRGSAVPLQTLAAATSGDLALTNTTGTASGTYSSGTGLTTVTMAGAGTALGYSDEAVAADGYELTVLGGGTATDGHATTGRAVEGVYPVVQATGVNTFTVTGNTGTATTMTTFLTKLNLLKLAYLEDGMESGLSEYVTPKLAVASQFVLTQGGATFILGGMTVATTSTAVLADPKDIGGDGDGARKVIQALGTNTTHGILVTVTSGLKVAGSALANIDALAAGEYSMLQWNGNYGNGTSGLWRAISGTATEA